MIRTFRRILFAAIILTIVATVLFIFVAPQSCSSSANNPIDNAKNSAINAAINASGIKDRIDEELRSHASGIAEQYGIPQATVNEIVDSLAIPEWEAISLPENVEQTGSFSIDVKGTPATITTYDDPGILTVNVYGQSITMAIPESAQSYASYIDFLKSMQ